MFVTLAVAVLSATWPGSESRLLPEKQPTNALRPFADNKFNSWTISRRLEMPVGRPQAEVAPMPRQVSR
jgi:hypothetical protein